MYAFLELISFLFFLALAGLEAPRPSVSCQTDTSSFVAPKPSDAESKLKALTVKYESLENNYRETKEALVRSKEELTQLRDEIESSRKHTAHIEEELIKAQNTPKVIPTTVSSPEKMTAATDEEVPPRCHLLMC